MRRVRPFRRGVFVAAGAVLFVLGAPAATLALVAGSKHDFVNSNAQDEKKDGAGNKRIDPGGVCTPCHDPHYSPDVPVNWPRDLTNKMNNERGASGFKETAEPGRTPVPTLLCYDCHENDSPNAIADDDPDWDSWPATRKAQDIALKGTAVGYWENACGGTAASPIGSPTGGHYWKSNPNSGTPEFYQPPSNARPARGDKITCTLCHDPHNKSTGPDAGKNEVFFRTSAWDGSKYEPIDNYGTGLTRSANSLDGNGDPPSPAGTPAGTGGREMCASCHRYAGDTNQETFFGVKVPPPTTNALVPEHNSVGPGSTAACTNCHGHNRVAGCKECHGYPPLVASAFDRVSEPYGESYAGGAGAHRRHLDALGTDIFKCDICHGPNAGWASTTWHNESSDPSCNAVDPTKIDIMGLTSYWGAGSSYNGVTGGSPPTGYAFAAKGGGAQRCANLICHGLPPDAANDAEALNWDDDMVYDTTDANAGNWIAPFGDSPRICKWCHDKTPARIGAGPWAPNVLGNGDDDGTINVVWATGTWGADVSGHGKATGNYDADTLGGLGGKAAANRTCTVCHDARYTAVAIPAPPLPYVLSTPIRTHFDGLYETSSSEKRLRDTINAQAVNQSTPAAAADASCGTCHQNGGAGAPEGTEVSTHGNDYDGSIEGARNSMPARACRQCHNVHGANWNNTGAVPRNLRLVGRWLDSTTGGTRGVAEAGEESRVDSTAGSGATDITTADAPVIFTAASGANSYDDGFGGGGEAPAQHESVCVVCHADLVNNHNEAGSTDVFGAGHNPTGVDCMQCHDHDYDNNPLTADAFAFSGCNGCHGTNATEPLLPNPCGTALRGQFWPDGDSPFASYDYADNLTGAHCEHVEAIAQQVFGESAAQVVLDYTGANPGLTSSDKQKTICAFCHIDPGGPGHSTDDAALPSGPARVNVYGGTAAGDWLRKYVPNAGSRAAYADDTTAPPNGYVYNASEAIGGTCLSLACHNQAATPAVGWNNPPTNWATVVNTDCSNITCHAAGTYTNNHLVHVDDGTNTHKNYACTECHPNNYTPVSLGHGNGEVDMVWNNPASLEGSGGLGNGFYDKNDPTYGDTGFAYKTGSYAIACNLVYCHGGDNAGWGGGDITPVWNNLPTDTTYCGSCHDGNGTGGALPGGTDVASTGNHTDHLTDPYGPRFALAAGIGPGTAAASCLGTATVGCHTNFLLTTATHVNGSTEFANIALTADVLAATDRCSSCHSTASFTFNIAGPATETGAGAALAKTNWASGTYTLPCLSCHNGADPATVFANGTGVVTAPDMLGDDVNYGAEIRGHNRSIAAGNYPVSANPPAVRTCDGAATGCHDAASVHINNAADITYAGNRMLGFVNGIPATTATEACNNCHATAAASPATKKSVNMHGNTDYADRLEGLFPAVSPSTYEMKCSYCHEPHGRTANGTGYNIYMVPGTITVPTPTAVQSAPGVRFEAKSGPFSFNDGVAPDTDDFCLVCHAANSMNYNEGGYHAAPGYDNDEEGSDCSGCHLHNRDNALASVDGLMPVACNTCHTFDANLPGNGVPAPHRLSASHDIHIGRPSNEAVVPNKGFVCNACHYQSSHNNRGIHPGDTWAGVTSAMVQVRFSDPARVPPLPQAAGPWNPVAFAGNPADRTQDSTSFSGGVCSDLYCHGDDPASFPAADAGTDTTPDWTSAATADCGTCHRYTAALPPGDLAHPKHAGNAAGQYSIGCQVCHYTTTTDGTTIVNMIPHVNHSADVVFNALADARVDASSDYPGDGAVGSGYDACTATYCHSNGTDRAAPYTLGSSAPATALAWNAGGSQCWNCHGDGAASGRPGYADGTPKGNKHPIHNGTDPDPLTSRNTNGYGCQVCHYATTHDNGLTLFATGTHVNRQYEVTPEGGAPALRNFGAYTPGSPDGTCAAVNCHAAGPAETVSWGLGGPITCDSCHARAAGNPAASDVNNFAWDGAVQSKVNAGEYDAANTGGHGKTSGPSVDQACADCHNNDLVNGIGHDRTMAGANPYRLRSFAGDQIAFCNTLCHATSVRTHDPDQMQAAGIAPNRTPWPAPWNTPTTSPRCVNCHDPHGDANLAMVNRELYDKSAFQLNVAAPAAPTEQTNLLFTDNVTGVKASAPYDSYADSNTFSSICQECHEDAGMVSFHDDLGGGTTFGANHPGVGGADCGDCHRHDAGFAPSGCEGCHNDVQTNYPLAPNVMGDGTDPDGTGTTPKPYDDGTFGYNVNGHGTNGTATNTPRQQIDPGPPPVYAPYLTPNAACTDCHDISDPSAGNGRHLNGILNSVELKQNLSTNTAHLRVATSTPPPAYPFIVSGASAYDVQVAFDRACYLNCHQPDGVSNMRHARDLVAGPTNSNVFPNAVRFGDKNTVADGETIAYPIDTALTTNASTGSDDFAPCTSCHNPHGTPVVEPNKGTNRMMRDQFDVQSTLCLVCHL